MLDLVQGGVVQVQVLPQGGHVPGCWPMILVVEFFTMPARAA